MIVKTFILENWRLIIDILSVIIVTIFFFIKKKPYKVLDTLKQAILINLPDWINAAEETGQRNLFSGNAKMSCVIVYAKAWFIANGFEFTPFYEDFIRKSVENILSTPKKKGELKDE